VSRLWAIASNTFRESVRDRVLYSLVFFAVLVVLASFVAEDITLGDTDKVVRSVALGAIKLFGSAFAIFLGVGLVYKELERKTIYTIASKPIPRWLFVVGKYLGLMGVIAANLLAMGALYTVVIGLQQGFPPALVYLNLVMLFLELSLLTAWALLFSTYSSPLVASFFSIGIFVIGNFADDIKRIGIASENPMTVKIAETVYWVLPNFSVISVHDAAVHGLAVDPGQVALSAAYAVGYTVVLVAGACWVFSGRDFK
jgi:ABC-type transport system involved in multi-copper enzyme maturation permease subunit